MESNFKTLIHLVMICIVLLSLLTRASITASTPVDQYYIIDSSSATSASYQVPAFVCPDCVTNSWTVTYTIVDSANTDAVASYAWITNFDSLTRTIDFSTADVLLANEYAITVVGVVNDGSLTPA